ncbi:helix-turn-helix transcriptional regulator [Gluconacetobacter sp.]|uniref:helix-turn-helix transcriptional regulator n=1 Tax=Gluconacetobacter sp. TaxID=1935994 RepID=UPI0039EC447A
MPGNPAIPPRRIIDLPGGMISYQAKSSPKPTGTNPDGIIPQSLFRKWIRDTDATLAGNDTTKASPAAELAKKIVTLRKAGGMSQNDLARALHVSRSAIAALETGRSSARGHIPRLAELFQVPEELFLSGMVEQAFPMTLSTDEHDLIELYRRLPTELKITVQKYVERQTRALPPKAGSVEIL